MQLLRVLAALILLATQPFTASAGEWGTGALMVVIERETGSVAVIDSANDHKFLGRVEGLGVLHHASIVFSRDGRYAYVVSRDSILSKIDLINLKVAAQVKTGESAVGLALSQDGKFIAISNYKPGNIVIVSDETFKIAKTINADKSKTVGMVDAPDDMFIVSLMDANAIWIIDAGKKDFPVVKKFTDIGEKPYDALLTPDGRYYMAGLFHSPWVTMIDLWNPEKITKIPLPVPKGMEDKPPVLKIPHLEGWIMAEDKLFAPVVGGSGLAVIDRETWTSKRFIETLAHPIFAMARPDMQQIWTNYVMGDFHDKVEVIDVKTEKVIKTLTPGNKIFHMHFTPKGREIYISSNGDNKVLVYDTKNFKKIKEIPVKNPSGVFCSSRLSQFGL
ncbi:MAG: protein nirF [Nitrospinota bacterium]|nr:protein nirF [Nitrospinota bacterium]